MVIGVCEYSAMTRDVLLRRRPDERDAALTPARSGGHVVEPMQQPAGVDPRHVRQLRPDEDGVRLQISRARDGQTAEVHLDYGIQMVLKRARERILLGDRDQDDRSAALGKAHGNAVALLHQTRRAACFAGRHVTHSDAVTSNESAGLRL